MSNSRVNAAEDEYFRRQEAERRSDEARDNLQQTIRVNQAEKVRLEAARLRRCPECKIGLAARTLRGIEIDQCNFCQGIWLDAGELEQLITPVHGFLTKLRGIWRG